ncbi:hypothetical protein EYF80_020876 [Liparis tanakae]|uniref:Uncharacterized protein n=1 Tax=Liparis tanakae TaxID=230148 RepID=A0A4Z2HTG5_9TELE|nr:hypothetical protein EYF80_020876 [Liparis tanakae]
MRHRAKDEAHSWCQIQFLLFNSRWRSETKALEEGEALEGDVSAGFVRNGHGDNVGQSLCLMDYSVSVRHVLPVLYLDLTASDHPAQLLLDLKTVDEPPAEGNVELVEIKLQQVAKQGKRPRTWRQLPELLGGSYTSDIYDSADESRGVHIKRSAKHLGGGGQQEGRKHKRLSWASPEVTLSSHVSILKVVVLPAPLKPRRPKHSPFPTARDSLSTARMFPPLLYTCEGETTAPHPCPLAAALHPPSEATDTWKDINNRVTIKRDSRGCRGEEAPQSVDTLQLDDEEQRDVDDALQGQGHQEAAHTGLRHREVVGLAQVDLQSHVDLRSHVDLQSHVDLRRL